MKERETDSVHKSGSSKKREKIEEGRGVKGAQ